MQLHILEKKRVSFETQQAHFISAQAYLQTSHITRIPTPHPPPHISNQKVKLTQPIQNTITVHKYTKYTSDFCISLLLYIVGLNIHASV